VKVQLATRVDELLLRRLRIYRIVADRTVEDIVSAALEGYLPSTADLVRDSGKPREEQPGMA
jgi:hypothetical protein